MTGKQVNTYNTRSAWGLARVHAITGEQRFLDAAVKNCEWALTQRNDFGWLSENCLQDNRQPFTHTIAYAMRGLLEVGAYAKREEFLPPPAESATPRAPRCPPAANCRAAWTLAGAPTVRWSCLTGATQPSPEYVFDQEVRW